MDELIRKAARLLRTLYISFWLVPVVVVILGETTEGWVGYYAGDVRTTYFAEALCILLAAICVPVSLKLFAWVLKRRIDVAAMGRALQMYVFWSGMRMVLLALPVIAGFLTYYAMLSTTGWTLTGSTSTQHCASPMLPAAICSMLSYRLMARCAWR